MVKGNTAEGKPEQWERPRVCHLYTRRIVKCNGLAYWRKQSQRHHSQGIKVDSYNLQQAKRVLGVMPKTLSEPKSLGILVRELTYGVGPFLSMLVLRS